MKPTKKKQSLESLKKKVKAAVDPASASQIMAAANFGKVVHDLFRAMAGGLMLGQIQIPDLLTGEARRDFAKYCHQTYNSPFFKIMVEALYYPQIMHAAREAENYEHVIFNRATANGIQLFADLFQKWAGIYDQEFAPQDQQFDPGRAFEPTS